MKINDVNSAQSFKGIVQLRIGDTQKPNGIIISNVNDSDMYDLTRKHGVCDTFCDEGENDPKISQYIAELAKKLNINLSNFGEIKSFVNRLDAIQIVGENATLEYRSDELEKTKKLRDALDFSA